MKQALNIINLQQVYKTQWTFLTHLKEPSLDGFPLETFKHIVSSVLENTQGSNKTFLFVLFQAILAFCWIYVRKYQSQRESEVVSTITAIFSLAIALITSALLPVDIFLVSYMKNQNGTFKVITIILCDFFSPFKFLAIKCLSLAVQYILCFYCCLQGINASGNAAQRMRMGQTPWKTRNKLLTDLRILIHQPSKCEESLLLI